jgi:ketosteroid isomerase-like protein
MLGIAATCRSSSPPQTTRLRDRTSTARLAHLRSDARGVGSGAEVELDQWFVATVREGKILRLQWFTDRIEALEAAGLSE